MTMPKTQATPEEHPVETLGSRLRNARTSQGKSLQEAAQVTCINPTTLANLEADNYTKMPAKVFTRGFITLYSQYLGLDAKESLNQYMNQEHHDPERPTEQPYRREILTGAAMARPLNLFRSNPRVLIIAILLALLLGFYALGAILKVGQKHPGQITPENELAKSLVDGNTQPLPGPPGEATPVPEAAEQSGVSGTTSPTPTLPEAQPGAGPAAGIPATAAQPASTSVPPVAEMPVPAVPATPLETGAARSVGVATTGQ